MKILNFLLASGLASVLAVAGNAALAAEHEVQMLNSGESGPMVFEPAFVRAEPGDVIRFIPTDMTHNVESIRGAIPEGAEEFRSKINDPFELTVTETGLYAVKCTPHFGMGMVAVIQVGDDTSNLEAVQSAKMPKRARERLDAALSEVN